MVKKTKNSEEIPKETLNKNESLNISPNKAWYIKQYKEKYLQFPTMKKIMDAFDNEKNDYLYLYGSYNRLNTLVAFGYFLDFDIVNMICTTFKIFDLQTNTESIYSFGYIEKESKIQKRGIKPINTPFEYRYFTTGSSFLSKDGEYRVGLISINNITSILAMPIIQNIFQEVSTYLHKKLIDRKMILTKEYFYPTDADKTIETDLEYYSFEIQKDLFAVAWFNTMFNLHLGIIENHLNKKYKQIMFKYKKDDLEFFNKLVIKYSFKQMSKLRYISNHIFLATNLAITKKETATKVGQKIIPLSIAEVQNPFNIRFKPWREYLISTHLSDYIVNNVSPGFFITNSWFYIKNSRKGLFDNDIQFERMQRSELAVQITELLSRAKIFTYENIHDQKAISKKLTKKTINTYISNKFKELSEKIQDPIDYAKEEIIMSNVAFCIISEYVGRTIMDVVLLSKSSSYYDKLIGSPFTLAGYPLFTKYMFELCYNLYCMNIRSGIIHGDLHLNNATLKGLTYTNIRNINDIKNPAVLYVLGDENSQYIFPTTGYYLCIIDFSRCIVLPEKINSFKDSSLPKTYDILDNMKEFQLDQVERLLNIYINYTTDSLSHIDELRILFKNKFEAVFKLLTVTDLFGFTQKLIMVFSSTDTSIPKLHKNCIDLLKKINNYAQQFLTVEMNKLISNKEYEQTILDMEWPIYTIIKNCFYEHLILNAPIQNIIDVYNINNPLTYSLNQLDKFPPVIKTPRYIKNKKEMIPYYIKIHNTLRKEFEKEKSQGMVMVNYIANRQKHKNL